MAEKYDFSKMFMNAEIKPIPKLQIKQTELVEITRCKNCKYWDTKIGTNCIIHEDDDSMWQENDFCSYGAPKERGGEK